MPTIYMAEPFGVVALFLADYGYSPVPIKPGYKAPLIDDWQAGHLPGHYLPHVDPETGKRTDCRSWGTGILTRNCPAVDLDIRDRELVRVLLELAADMLGPSPFRVGAPPKALMPFSAAEPFDKISGRWWALPGDNWPAPDYTPHHVEILGNGQQFVAYARHPRGSFYRWRRGEPMDTYLIDLPEIDQAAAQAFLEAAEQLISDMGAVPLRKPAGLWRPDLPQPIEQRRPRPRRLPSPEGDFVSGWQLLDPKYVARAIDPQGAHRTKNGWSCKCPVHRGDGNTSLGITTGNNGLLIVNCFAGCDWRDVHDEIDRITGGPAA